MFARSVNVCETFSIEKFMTFRIGQGQLLSWSDKNLFLLELQHWRQDLHLILVLLYNSMSPIEMQFINKNHNCSQI